MSGVADKLILLTAGGTGGHVFPAEALAEALLAQGYRLALVTDRRGKAYGGTLGSLETFRISAGGIAGRGLVARLRAIAALGRGYFEARRLIHRLRPTVVVGFGGYASVPAVLAASHAGLPCLLHEQNAVLGRANRLLAKGARQIATSFAEVSHLAEAWRQKVVLTGMPVRAPVAARSAEPYPGLTADGPVRILVLGGSQGARVLSDLVPEALAALPAELAGRIALSQQCRPEDLERVRAAYAGTPIRAELASFFEDVPERMAAAHLVIARSGASTVAELTTLGRPAILIPYPFAIDDHQSANARAVGAAGAGWVASQAELTAADLAGRLQSLISQPQSLTSAAAAAKRIGLPDAAARLARVVDRLASDMQEVPS